MKKYWHDPDYKKWHAKRSKASLRKRIRHREFRKRANSRLYGAKKEIRKEWRESIQVKNDAARFDRNAIIVHAPPIMCFLMNTNAMTLFIEKLNQASRDRHPIYVDLSRVVHLELNAVTALLSVMVKIKSSGIKVHGTNPSNHQVRKLFFESRFFGHLYKTFSPEANYDLPGSSIYTHGKKTVDSVFSDKLIGRASKTIWGEKRRCTGLQRAIVELMQNTHNHASSTQGEQHYWISLQHIKSENRVVFTFVDFGVGVFETLKGKKPNEKFYSTLKRWFSRGDNNATILKKIFSGELHQTSTGKYYRGKGLPGLFNVFREKRISNLSLITNDVFFDSDGNSYSKLSRDFPGTMIVWELNSNNESKPNTT